MEIKDNEWAIEITMTDGEVLFYQQRDDSEIGALRFAWKMGRKEYVESIRIFHRVKVEPFGHEWACAF